MKIEHKLDAETLRLSKRTYLPFIVTDECPKCHESVESDLTERYLAFPTIGAEHVFHPYCEACDHDWPVRLYFDVFLGKSGTCAGCDTAKAMPDLFKCKNGRLWCGDCPPT